MNWSYYVKITLTPYNTVYQIMN